MKIIEDVLKYVPITNKSDWRKTEIMGYPDFINVKNGEELMYINKDGETRHGILKHNQYFVNGNHWNFEGIQIVWNFKLHFE